MGCAVNTTANRRLKVSIRLYQIKDRTAGIMSSGIIMHSNDRAAMRWFGDAMSDQRNIMTKHPEDYDLYQVGEQEDDGTIVGLIPPVIIITGDAMAEMLNRKAMQQQAQSDRYNEMLNAKGPMRPQELPGQLKLEDI